MNFQKFITLLALTLPAALAITNSSNVQFNRLQEPNQPFYYYYTPSEYWRRAEDASQGPGVPYTNAVPQAPSADYSNYHLNDLADQAAALNNAYPADQSSKFRYNIYPGVDATHNSYSYLPPKGPGGGYHGGAVGWRPAQGDDGLIGILDKIVDELNLDKLLFSPVASFLGFDGVKGSVGLVKLGFILAFLLVPLITLVLVPLTAFVVILVFSIPIPVWRPVTRSTEAFTGRLLAADDCVEKISCSIAKFSQKFTKMDIAFKGKIDDLAKRNKSKEWRAKAARGYEAGISNSTDCQLFKCDPIHVVKQFFRS